MPGPSRDISLPRTELVTWSCKRKEIRPLFIVSFLTYSTITSKSFKADLTMFDTSSSDLERMPGKSCDYFCSNRTFCSFNSNVFGVHKMVTFFFLIAFRRWSCGNVKINNFVYVYSASVSSWWIRNCVKIRAANENEIKRIKMIWDYWKAHSHLYAFTTETKYPYIVQTSHASVYEQLTHSADWESAYLFNHSYRCGTINVCDSAT